MKAILKDEIEKYKMFFDEIEKNGAQPGCKLAKILEMRSYGYFLTACKNLKFLTNTGGRVHPFYKSHIIFEPIHGRKIFDEIKKLVQLSTQEQLRKEREQKLLRINKLSPLGQSIPLPTNCEDNAIIAYREEKLKVKKLQEEIQVLKNTVPKPVLLNDSENWTIKKSTVKKIIINVKIAFFSSIIFLSGYLLCKFLH